MTTFPAIEPSTRQISFGDYPQLNHDGVSGVGVRFLQGTDRVTQVLSLRWLYLSESQLYQILNHYIGQEGTMLSFDLPAIIWSGFTTPPIGVEYEWRYADQVDVEQAAPLSYNVGVQLVSVLLAP